MVASLHGDVWAGSIRLAASTAFSYQAVAVGVDPYWAFSLQLRGSELPSTCASHCYILSPV